VCNIISTNFSTTIPLYADMKSCGFDYELRDITFAQFYIWFVLVFTYHILCKKILIPNYSIRYGILIMRLMAIIKTKRATQFDFTDNTYVSH